MAIGKPRIVDDEPACFRLDYHREIWRRVNGVSVDRIPPFRKKNFLARVARNLTRWLSIDYFRSMKRRIWVLEQTVDMLLSSPAFDPDDATGFNGQAGRKRIFESLVRELRFDCFVETGTFVGNTAGWMHHVSKLPVFSSEINPRLHLLARKRLTSFRGIQLELSNSVDFLAKLAASPLKEKFVFFYLDAHWYKNLPLAAELNIISDGWRRFVIMVDDFEVPRDEGYGFDDYGFGRSLTVGTFRPLFERLSLATYFPTLPFVLETGARSGCVVLVRKDSEEARVLDRLDDLSRY